MNTFALTETSNPPHHHHWSTFAKQCLTNFTRLWIPQSHPVCASKKLLNCSTLICASCNLKPLHTIGPLTRRTVGMPNELKKLKGWKRQQSDFFSILPIRVPLLYFENHIESKDFRCLVKRGALYESTTLKTKCWQFRRDKWQFWRDKRQETILKRQPRSFALSGSRATAGQ